ncbi:MAG: tRNA uridine-5-carboxymethylaminomethyl(34) synthesis enzyme MnmG [Thermoleophilia bacterium]
MKMRPTRRQDYDVTRPEYDVIVVGGGHAGCEASLAAARMGRRTALITLSVERVALMPCNPAVGGVGKGQLTREIDALGGQQGRTIDRAFIQIKMLNTSKGPAVQALRAQADKRLYEDWMKRAIAEESNLEIVEGEVVAIDVSRETFRGVWLHDGRYVSAAAFVLASGTFLRGRVIVGSESYAGGRVGELPASSLSQSLQEHGLELGRFQSATPPRVDGRTIDCARMSKQPGDELPSGFSHWESPRPRRQEPCYLTHTTAHTHRLVAEHLHLSPIKTGSVSGKGPRYCPSIDRKIINFPDRDRHPVFVEPEGLHTHEVYLQGLTTSLPVEIQELIIKATPGLENARLVRPGYAVEYDYLVPEQLTLWLETKAIRGFFSAGQVNGTSGYEEAAAQGLIAGINAALYVAGEPPFTLRRDQAYIGVLIDDLVTKGVDEPYRMFTSRAEYRLLLRHDNAAERLAPLGHALGLLSDEQLEKVREKERQVALLQERLAGEMVRPDAEVNDLLESLGTTPLSEPQPAIKLLKRPQVGAEDLVRILAGGSGAGSDLGSSNGGRGIKHAAPDSSDSPTSPSSGSDYLAEVDLEVLQQIAIRARYDGYIQRQLEEIRRHRETESQALPRDLDYRSLEGITVEARDKLNRMKPATLGQASRIAGVSPADISVLLLHLHRMKHAEGPSPEVAGISKWEEPAGPGHGRSTAGNRTA